MTRAGSSRVCRVDSDTGHGAGLTRTRATVSAGACPRMALAMAVKTGRADKRAVAGGAPAAAAATAAPLASTVLRPAVCSTRASESCWTDSENPVPRRRVLGPRATRAGALAVGGRFRQTRHWLLRIRVRPLVSRTAKPFA